MIEKYYYFNLKISHKRKNFNYNSFILYTVFCITCKHYLNYLQQNNYEISLLTENYKSLKIMNECTSATSSFVRSFAFTFKIIIIINNEDETLTNYKLFN